MSPRKPPEPPKRGRRSAGADPAAGAPRRHPSRRRSAETGEKQAPDAQVVPIGRKKGRAAPRGTKLAQGRGRLTALTPEIQERVVQVVAAGNYLEVAATYAGVNRTTLFNWLARGRNEIARVEGLWLSEAERQGVPPEAVDPPPFDPIEHVFVNFFDAVQAADAQAEIRDIGYLESAKDWRARAWVRERRAPTRWGARDRTTLTIEGGETPVGIELTSEEQRARKVEILDVLIEVGAFALPEGGDDDED